MARQAFQRCRQSVDTHHHNGLEIARFYGGAGAGDRLCILGVGRPAQGQTTGHRRGPVCGGHAVCDCRGPLECRHHRPAAQGSLDGILRSGGKRGDIEIVRVPGAWEIPDAARKLAETKKYDAIITLGCLLRGETAHYEAIYNEVSRGIGQSQQETGIPHAFGVLTCETLEQALNRAGIKAGNKGFEAAVAAIEMVSIHREIEAAP
jgi:6,7-dimethyl-8-ribityllumazine synthase